MFKEKKKSNNFCIKMLLRKMIGMKKKIVQQTIGNSVDDEIIRELISDQKAQDLFEKQINIL